jgi:general secretion pathway protein D
VGQPGSGRGEREIGPQKGRPGQQGVPVRGERQARSCEEIRRNGKYNIFFDKVEIEKLVQTVADATCKTFILPETVRGKISIIGPENGKGEVDADQFYAAFAAALDANNLTLYPHGRYIKIVDKTKAKQQPLPTLVEPDEGYTTNDQMVTRFFKVRYVEVDKLKGVLQGLVSQPGGEVVTFEPDTLIITEIGSNMHRLQRIIQQLDAPSSSSELRIIHLNHAAAQDVADKIQKLFEAKGQRPGQRPGQPPITGGVTPPAPPPGTPPGQPTPTPATQETGASTGPATLSQLLPDERTNQLIIVASPAAFDRIYSLIRAIDVPIAGEGRINVYFLQNTAAEEIANTLQALAQGSANRPRQQPGVPAGTPQPPGTPPGGRAPGQPVTAAELFSGEVKISADKSSNALVVIASQNDYRSLKKIIDELDLARRQVFIEAVIMEVNLDRTSEFGMNLHTGFVLKTDKYGNVPGLIGTKYTKQGLPPSFSLANLASFGGFLAGLQGPNIPELEKLGLSIPQFGIVLHALQQSSDVNVLSTPHILATDNEDAEITVGQNVPFQAGFSPATLGALPTSGTTPGVTPGTGIPGGLGSSLLGLGSFFAPITRQNVELKLTVKPHINKSDDVRMVINEQTEEIASQDPVLGPTTSKRSAKTTVVAKDQETVVLGGIMQDRTIESVAKVPVLGDIPLLGHFFREQSRHKVKTNLLLFLTPYIIKDKSDFRRIFERKLKERQQFIEQFYGQVPGYEVAIDFDRKPGPIARLTQAARMEERKLENGGPGRPGERLIQPGFQPSPGAQPIGPRTETAPVGQMRAPEPAMQERQPTPETPQTEMRSGETAREGAEQKPPPPPPDDRND